MVYDAADGYVVLFSGSGASDDTWTFSAGKWTEITTPTPPERTYAAMAYDAYNGYVLLFGGHDGTTFFGDTWTFHGGIWKNISSTVGPAPSARAFAAVTYYGNASDGYVLLFGGNDSNPPQADGGYFSDTWEFNGTWAQLPSGGVLCGGANQPSCAPGSAPTPRATGSMTYDPIDQYAVLYGGGSTKNISLDDTWTFSGGVWKNITSTSGLIPSRSYFSRYYTMMTFDAADGYVLLFGGVNGSDLASNLTWGFVHGVWSDLTSSLSIKPSPPARFGGAMAFDGADGSTVLFGGLSNVKANNSTQTPPTLGDTWTYLDGDWTNITPQAYMVTFSESGLLKGMSWNVTTDDNVVSSNSVFVRFYLPSGTYPYTAAVSGGYTVPISGNLTVGTKNVEVPVNFNGEKYTASFTESHLPKNTAWSVTIFGQQVSSSNDGTIKFQSTNALFNGTYTYRIGVVPGYRTTDQANITIDGANIAVLVNFVPALYTVTFSESGLPAHTTWKVTLNGASNSSTASYENFSEPNGTFAYSIGIVPGYSTTDSGTVVVNGANASISVTFGVTEFSVTFVEAGLPTADLWYVNITPGPDLVGSGAASQLSTSLANGTYSITVTTNDRTHAASYAPNFQVKGKALSIGLTFTPYTYKVTFKETGLPSGTNWSVTANSLTQYSKTNSIPFLEVNGTYNYTANGSAPFPFTVRGSPLTVTTPFYKVTFTESGLAKNTSWQVTLAGATLAQPAASIIFYLANGTYGYRIGLVSGYRTTDAGSLMVKGVSLTVRPSFLRTTYTVKFTETGLPSGTRWYVVFDDINTSVTTSSISFTGVANGTFGYTIGQQVGYALNGPYSGSVTVAGGGQGTTSNTVSVAWTPARYSAMFEETGLPAGWIWNVTVKGTTISSGTNATTFQEPNGSYSFAVVSSGKLYQPIYTPSFAINGASVMVNVSFSLYTRPVTFKESGLPSGTSWNVTVGAVTHGASTSSIAFTEPNGTYTYTATVAAFGDTYGQFTVKGSSVTVNLAYYKVSFTKSGLPSNSSWQVTTNGATQTSTGTIVFYLVDGAYSYQIGIVPGYTARDSGNITVHSAALTQPTPFTQLKYTITFKETGLSQVNWSVTIGATTIATNASTHVFKLANGTQSYSIAAPTGYTADPVNGTFPVNGSSLTISVTFTWHPASRGDPALPSSTEGPEPQAPVRFL
jgi:hypothetical protein